MTATVVTRNLRKDFCPLPFRGFISTGHCFLRVDLHAGKFTVLCSQLPGYAGTSITNAVEEIIDSLLCHLMAEMPTVGPPAVEVRPRFRWLRNRFLSAQARNAEDLASARAYLQRNCLWIEHYPPELAIANRETYALVSFNASGSPSWHYLPREMILTQLSDPGFLTLDTETLAAWASNSLPSR